MALSIFMHGSRNLPILNNAASKLLCSQFKNSQLVFTPILAKNFSGFNSPIVNAKKLNGNNLNLVQATQSRMISHSAIWTAEKALSLALLGIIPGCLVLANPITDNILAVVLVLHMHWGVESVIVDYIRPALVGPVIPKIAKALVYIMSAFTLAGLLYFNYNDMGLSQAVRRFWAIKPKSSE